MIQIPEQLKNKGFRFLKLKPRDKTPLEKEWQKNSNYNLMHCNSTYPTPFKDINLYYIKTLENISNRNVGYSGHERGIEIPIAAVALGYTIIEKHIHKH